MNDFIKGDTSLIKDLTDELNRLRQDNSKLLDELNITKLTLAEKEQERQDFLNDNKYNKNLCSELTQQLTDKENEIEKLKIILSMQAVQVPEKQRVNLITTNCVQYNPNQTAIAELEKVKKLLKHKGFVLKVKPPITMPTVPGNEYLHEFMILEDDFDKIFDQQIKSLKGGTNE